MKLKIMMAPLLMLCASCSGSSFKTVEIDEFMKVIQDDAVIVLDVRTEGEHAEGCIPGTDYNIDVLKDDFEEKSVKTLPAKSKIAVYCRSGNRSKKAGEILSGNGYKVIELGSGYKGWKAWNDQQKH